MIRQFKYVLLLGFTFILASVYSQNNPSFVKNAKFPFVDKSKESVWGGDLMLSIVDTKQVGNFKIFTVQSVYKNKYVGLLIQVPNKPNGKSGFGNEVIIKSLGSVSDNFLKALAEIYKVNLSGNKSFIKSISTSYVDLDDFAQSVVGKRVDKRLNQERELKLFFENSADEAELYLNIDESANRIELREKDSDYRKSIITFLTQK